MQEIFYLMRDKNEIQKIKNYPRRLDGRLMVFRLFTCGLMPSILSDGGTLICSGMRTCPKSTVKAEKKIVELNFT